MSCIYSFWFITFKAISGIIAPLQPGNGSPSSEPKIMVETPDGIVEMSSLEYQRYLVEKGLAGQAAPELKPGNGPQELPGRPGNVERDPQPRRPAGAEEASVPACLRVSEWAEWVDKDPAELVKHLTAKALEEDIEAQAALDFLQHCSLQELVALLEANKENTDNPTVESAITILLEDQVWLQAAIGLIQQLNGALGEGQG